MTAVTESWRPGWHNRTKTEAMEALEPIYQLSAAMLQRAIADAQGSDYCVSTYPPAQRPARRKMVQAEARDWLRSADFERWVDLLFSDEVNRHQMLGLVAEILAED